MICTPLSAHGHLRLLTFAVLLLLVSGPVPQTASAAQTPMATVTGTVTDTSGGVLAGATVDAVTAGRVVATDRTSSDGRYRLEVPAGVPYELRARREGFADQLVAGTGAAGAVARDITMRIGGVSDTLVVTASRAPEGRATVTGSMSVVTTADIAALGAASLSDVVRTVPGVNAEGAGREGALTAMFSRGGESDYNLVLIDGVRVNESGGAFDFSRVAAAEIERVEVMRGAQSALYGSDAMGAVVQVFTRRAATADPPQLSGHVEGGSFNTWRGGARVAGGARGRVDYHAGVSLRRTDGAFADTLPEKDTFEQRAFDGSFGTTLGHRASVRTGLRYSDADGRDVGPIAYLPGDTGTRSETTDLSWHADAAHTMGSRATGSATISYFRADRLSEDSFADAFPGVYAILQGTPGARFPASPRLVRLVTEPEFQALAANPQRLGPGEFLAFPAFGVFDFAPDRTEIEFRRPAFKYQADLTWAGQRLSSGYEFERESSPLVPEYRTHNNAVFIQQQFTAADRWFATIGARVDDKSRHGTFFSPKLSVGGFLLPFRRGTVSSVKVFANAGKGIKSPQFGELFGSAFADGNIDLEPERARSIDLGAEATFADQRLRAAVAYFDNNFRDQIEYRSSGGFGTDGRPDFFNVAGSEAHGVEVEVVLQRAVAGVTAAAWYAYVDSQVTETVNTGVQFLAGQPLLRRPKHSGMIRAGYDLRRATIHLDVEMRGERHDSSFLFLTTVAGPTVPDGVFTDVTVNRAYAVAGLGVDVRVHDGLTVFLRGANITDTQFETVLGYPGLPRTFMLGARFLVGR